MLRSFAPAVLSLILLLSVGCMSTDTQLISSTVFEPKTASVQNTVNGETIWTRDVPVETMLSVQFESPGGGLGNAEGYPTSMEVKLFERKGTSQYAGGKKGEMLEEEVVELPGVPVILNVELRPLTPEESSQFNTATSAPPATATQP